MALRFKTVTARTFSVALYASGKSGVFLRNHREPHYTGGKAFRAVLKKDGCLFKYRSAAFESAIMACSHKAQTARFLCLFVRFCVVVPLLSSSNALKSTETA
jgi:hypothetical protein